MRLEQLKYVIEIAKYNSIAIASEKLHISQPSLSVAIKQLENELNTTIFIRSRKGTTLTESGTEIYRTCCKIMDEIQALYKNDELLCLENTIPRYISLLSAIGFKYVINNTVRNIQKNNAQVQFQCTILDAEKINTMLFNKNDHDFIFTTLPTQEIFQYKDKLLENYKLYLISQANIHLLASKRSPLANKKNITFSALQKIPLCTVVQEGDNDTFLFSLVERYNVKLHRSIITSDYNSITEYVSMGDLYSLITPFPHTGIDITNNCVLIPLKHKISVSFIMLINRNVSYTPLHELLFQHFFDYYPKMKELT